MLADEIKFIREQKRMERNAGSGGLMDGKVVVGKKSSKSQTNGNIRIKVVQGYSKNYRGLYCNSNHVIRA